MSEVYKLVHPGKYFSDYILQNTRPDGRKFRDHRNIKVNVNAISAADASAVVKCGNTTVICGIKLELATPKAEEPDFGFLITNVELPPLCHSKYKPGPPPDHAQVISNLVSDIIVNSKCVNLKDLCIVSDKLAWVLYCDMVCIDNDGSVVDACIISLLTSLKTLTLPLVKYNPETDSIDVEDTVRTPLEIHGLPVATSFSVFRSPQSTVILTDPTSYEEEMSGSLGSYMVVCCNQGLLCGLQKFGGSSISTDIEEEALKIAKERETLVKNVIDTCINDVK